MREIKISDLSIGDWVRYDRGTDAVQIMGIYVRNNQECVVMSDSYFPDGVIGFVECIKPIPLTPEILEKNGFVKCSRYCTSRTTAYIKDFTFVNHLEERKVWRVKIYGEEGLVELCSILVHHTHQLQHALRLAGVKKEIEV